MGIDSLVRVLEEVHQDINSRIPDTIIWVRLDDLSCGACLEDFLTLTSVLGSDSIRRKAGILYLVEKDRRPNHILERVVERWREIHSIPFPVYIVEGFQKLGLQKSCVLLKQDGLYVGEYMPMSTEKKKAIISRLTN
jgi:hypothetical protein